MRAAKPLGLGLLLLACATAVVAQGHTTVILVRHAERASKAGNSALKEPKGFLRARALVEAVGDAGISTIIASEYLRTQQTVAATASHLGIPDLVLQITAPGDVAEEILQRHRGRTVLVAGHSNTVPQIIEALGGPSLCPDRGGAIVDGECRIPDKEHDHLYVVTIGDDGQVGFLASRYGDR